MLGAKINGYHTGDFFGLGWIGMSITKPEVKTHYIEIEGRDGPLDATEALSGRPVYKQRILTLIFDARNGSWDEYMARCSNIDSRIHGRLCEIFLDIDPKYFWVGRGTWEHSKTADGEEQHTFTAMVEPYKYKKNMTSQTVTVSGTSRVTLQNLQAPCHPLFSTTASGLQVQYGSVTYTIPTGTDKEFYDITLLEGANVLTFSGSGTVKIKYQEGVL